MLRRSGNLKDESEWANEIGPAVPERVMEGEAGRDV
jgi:hypothetical protein